MHIAGENDIYRKLGKKIDNLYVRAPWNETWHSILKELFTTEEADVVVKMPYTPATLEKISRISGVEKNRLHGILDNLCAKGLIMDLWSEPHGQYFYIPNPIAIGIFEFTMMRSGDNLDFKKLAGLFHEYFGSVNTANFSNNEQISALRVIPVEESITEGSLTEFFAYEKVTALIADAGKLAIGTCSCRNEKLHTGEKKCEAPLDTCSLLGMGAQYGIRNNLAREVTQSEMMDNIARSREHDLVFCAANTRRTPIAICHCCPCCCNFLGAMTKYGFKNCVVTSTFIAKINAGLCTGCGKCVDVCPVSAAGLHSANDPTNKKKRKARVSEDLCVGCGICKTKCAAGALEMISRESKVIRPESIFEAMMLSSLERGTLQNQLFDNPMSLTQDVMRSFLGAFLKQSAVKRTLLSDMFRSTFLGSAKVAAKMQGKGWMVDI